MRQNNIQKILLFSVVFSTMSFFVSAAAVTPAPAREAGRAIQVENRDRKDVMRAEIKSKREDFRNDAEERLESLKKHFGDLRAKRIEEFFNSMTRKFENAVDRLDEIADRIKNHLNKLDGQGKDVSELNLKLEAAENKISDAEEVLAEAKSKFNAMASSTDPKQTFKDVKILVQGVSVKIKEAHAALVDVINSVKGASDKATTTRSK